MGASGPPIDWTFADPVATERLVLRSLRPDDLERLHAYRSLPEVARWVPFAPMSREEISERLAGRWAQLRIAGDGEGVCIGVARADTGELIGDLTLWCESVEHRGGQVGWVLNPAQGGRGYATEAARALLGIAFERIGLHRVVARVDARNAASMAVCERLGMRREAVLRENEWFKGGWSDEVDYALLESEWPSSASSGSRSAIESTIRDGR